MPTIAARIIDVLFHVLVAYDGKYVTKSTSLSACRRGGMIYTGRFG
jgi:hypothetical protein